MQNFIAKLGHKYNMVNEKELTGKIYGYWTIIGLSNKKSKYRQPYVVCKCKCGTEKEVLLTTLRSGRSKSCGCYRKEQLKETPHNYLHGKQGTPEYNSWNSMIHRCCNKKHKNYSDYGGRGIKVCDKWLDKITGVIQFIQDVGEKPEPKHLYSLDRIDNEGNYEPGNVRWAKSSTQNNNRRKSVVLSKYSDEELLEECKKRGLL